MGQIKVLVIPYKTFKERIKLTKKYEHKYKIENMGSYLYLEEKHVTQRVILGEKIYVNRKECGAL